VSFDVANLDDFSATEQFDALVGRYILLYQPDPAATIARLSRFLKPSGIVVFHEVDFAIINPSFPQCELYDQIHALNTEVSRRVGFLRIWTPDWQSHLDAGLSLPS
jgi:ubiquinone/menaquinone biosynthesis C-methylase UbiE